MGAKILSQKLEKELDAAGYPQYMEARVLAFSKVFKLSKHTSASILCGTRLPSEDILEAIALEFEVTVDWLLGDTDSKH